MTMFRRLAFALVLASAAPAHAELAIFDNHRTLDVDCAQDPEVSLVGNHITITTTGVCARITVLGNHATVTGSAIEVSIAGNHNTITLAAADDVAIAGNRNTLTVRAGVKRKTPRVTNLGRDNRVTRQVPAS
jgi:hypothetical protein